MDAGMRRKEESTPLTFNVAVQTGQIKLKNLSNSELIGIIDSIYSSLISWLEGNSLAQTVLTCLYLHAPSQIENKTLKAFCISILKLIDSIARQITSVKVYEEEDFQSSTYGYDFCGEIHCTTALAMLKQAEEDFIRLTKQEDNPSEEITGITGRLKFTRFLLSVFVILEPKPNSETTEIEMNEVVRLLNAALELIPIIRRSVGLGIQPVRDAPCCLGFSPMVNQRLLPPTFPRFTKFKDCLSCVSYLEDLVQRMKLACKIIYCTNYQSALTFFKDFSKKASSCLLSRTLLQRLYFRDAPNSDKIFGNIAVEDMLRKSIKEFICPAALQPDHPLHTNEVAQGCIKSFLFFNQTPFLSFFEIFGYNQARQRDKLAKLLDSFSSLQDEAERVDNLFYKNMSYTTDDNPKNVACFGTWVLYYTLRAMSFYLLSGLELELYSAHELCFIYWYLFEFLFGWLISALSRADSYLEINNKETNKLQKKNKTNKKKKYRCHALEIMHYQALQNMCGGYFKSLTAFIKEDKISQPLPMFDNEKIRYEHRFAPFADLVTPPPISYFDFKRMESQMLKATSIDLFISASKHFHQARNILETIPNPDSETNNILKVAKFNFVVTNLLASGHKKGSRMCPLFDFSIHKCYPIIKLK